MGGPVTRLLFPDWLRRLLTQPVSELTRWQRTLRFSIELARHCAGELHHDKAGQMAAALTYHTLFSILPMLVLVLVALNAFVGPDQRAAFKTWVVDRAVTSLESEPFPSVEETADEGGRRQEFEAVRQRLDQELQGVLNSLERVSFRSIGLAGILVFIYGATALLATVERSFNAVFGVASGRPWYLRLPLYYTVITLGPLLVLIGQWLKGRFLGVIEAGSWTNWLVGPAALAAPLGATWLVLYLMFVLLPTARVSKRAAVVGSFVAAVLLAVARELFRIYVARAAVTTLYGALALVPLFLLLLWLIWLIVLFGLELTYTLGAMRGRRFKRERHKLHGHQLVDPAWSVPLSLCIAEAFDRGEACTADDLSRETCLPQPVVMKLLAALEGAGLVHAVRAQHARQYALARPAARIGVVEVLEAGRSALAPTAGERAEGEGWALVDHMDRAGRRVAGDQSLGDLLAPPSGGD